MNTRNYRVIASAIALSCFCSIFATPVAPQGLPLKFASPVAYGSGGPTPLSVVVADVNGDGKPDLIVANCGSYPGTCESEVGSVAVLLGNCDGTFQKAVTYGSGGLGGYAVAAADVNGDGKPDLLVANMCNSNSNSNCTAGSYGVVGVLLGNGDGTFQTAVPYSSGGYRALSVAVADVNGDGKPDLVVANQDASYSDPDGSVSVLLGNGNGTFSAPVSYLSGGVAAYSVAVADVNKDGKLDLVVAVACEDNECTTNSVVGVLLGNGDGTFQPAVTYTSGGYESYSLAVQDVNGDGKPDLVTGNVCASSDVCTNGIVGVLLGNGDGTFQAAVPYNTGGLYGYAVTVADVNGDGKPDVVVANVCASSSDCPATTDSGPASVGVLTGKGDGTFEPAVTYASGGGRGAAVAVADISGDGRPDLLMANWCVSDGSCASGNVGVLINLGTFATTTSLGSSLNTSVFGQPVTFTSTVTSLGSGTPTGTLTFADGANTLGSVILNGGTANFVTSSLNAGSHSITASYSGDANFSPSSSSVLTQIVNQATSTVALASIPNPAIFGQSVTFTATIKSEFGGVATGTITFQNGSTALGGFAVSGNSAVFTTSGLPIAANQITATYMGDGNNAASTSPILKEVVHKDPTTTYVTPSANPILAGQNILLTASVASAYGTVNGGVVTLKNGSTTIGSVGINEGSGHMYISNLPAGSDSITGSYSGGLTELPSTSVPFIETVNKYSTTTSATSTVNPSSFGQSVNFSATVTSSSGGTPTGTVTFKNASATLGTVTLSGGAASLNTSALAVGTHSITVSYSGDATNAGSTSPAIIQVVNKASTTASITSSVNPSIFGQPVTFSTTVSSSSGGIPTGVVSFKNASGGIIASATLSGGAASVSTSGLNVGTQSIFVTYAGDATHLTSTSADISQVITPAATTTTLSSSPDPSTAGQSVTLTATVTSSTGPAPGGSVTFKSGTRSLGAATLVGGVATISTTALAVGSDVITATYPGTANFTGSSAALTQVVN